MQFLELVGLTAGVILFSEAVKDATVTLWCDNQAVQQMVNNGASSCPHCMKLIRFINLFSMKMNVKYEVKYINTKLNTDSDLLSRLKVTEFLKRIPSNWEAIRLMMPKRLIPLKKIF